MATSEQDTSAERTRGDQRLNLLYRLDERPDIALVQIVDAYRLAAQPKSGRSRLLHDVTRLLRDEAVDPAVTLRIGRLYAYLVHPDAGAHRNGDRFAPWHNLRARRAQGRAELVRGALAVYLGLNAAATHAVTEGADDDLLAAARAWLSPPEALDCLHELYRIPPERLDLTGARLHRIGTTSLIFQCNNRHEAFGLTSKKVALKCLLPRYFGVQAVREQTHGYKTHHNMESVHAPDIGDSDETWIAMEFIEGPTLADAIARDLPDIPPDADSKTVAQARAPDAERLEYLRGVLVALCRILSDLLDSQRAHLDLSPSNIIITSKPDAPIELRLIDFGHNYTVLEQVGSSTTVNRAALYVAPELLAHPQGGDWRCDVYSLGIILLEMAARRPLEREDLRPQLDRLWTGDEAWSGAPGLARIVEELVDRDPSRRLLLRESVDRRSQSRRRRHESDNVTSDPYHYLEALIEQEVEVQSIYEKRTGRDGYGLLKGSGLVVGLTTQIKNLRDTTKATDAPAVDETYRDYPALSRWAGLAVAAWSFTALCFLYLTAADLHFWSFPPPVAWLIRHTHPHFVSWVTLDHRQMFKLDRLWSNLPGRLEALSFAVINVMFYVNNYSTLSPKRVGSTRRRLGHLTDFLLHASVVVLPIPVLWAMIWNPRAWPLCSGFGTLLVVGANWLLLRLARDAYEMGRHYRFSTVSDTAHAFIESNYSEWWVLMLFYSLSLIGIGFLLNAGVTAGPGLFAGLVIFVNLGKIYRINCVNEAPRVRGWLTWAILTLRRSDVARTLQLDADDGRDFAPAAVTTVRTAYAMIADGVGD